ncbi:MAG: aspartate aminotransferase family protein, partial [Hamadaea sp.]|nr:aspartate aminotransferase family protein [Hamadaea sp.]
VNGLDPTAFPSIVRLEREVVAAVASRLGGDAATPGIFTSGGTESIILAVKAARDSRPDVANPEIVVPTTVHAAFHKAGHYLGVRVKQVPVSLTSFRALPDAMADAITDDTVLVVASAPSYAHGVIDPVAEIASLCQERGVACHVDACVGGWLLPWLADAGAVIPPFDLSVPGVTSLSVDLHKFGYAPKGASVLLFSDPELRLRAYFACAEWPGYTVINSTIQSSKGAGPLAGAWATLQALGTSGYQALGAAALEATRAVVRGISEIPGLRVLGTPDATLVAFTVDDDPGLDVFTIADEARARGFFLQPQLSYAGMPASLHLTLTGVSASGVDALLSTLSVAVEAARAVGPVPTAGLAEMIGGLDFATLDDATFASLLPAVGVSFAAGTPRMAAVNAVLDGLPPASREALLTRFLSALYSPALT